MNWDLVVIFGFALAMMGMRLHYRRMDREAGGGGGLSLNDQNALQGAMEQARRLETRVETLERLLDEDVPGWRARARA